MTTAEEREAAERILRDLRAREDAFREQLKDNGHKRADLALLAETGDAGARFADAKLASEAVELRERLQRIATAIGDAEQNILAASDPTKVKAERERAKEVEALLREDEALDVQIDGGLAHVKSGFQRKHEINRKLASLGVPVPSGRLVEVNTERALDAALFGQHPAMRPVPPNQRHSFVELGKGWRIAGWAWAKRILAGPVKVKEAA